MIGVVILTAKRPDEKLGVMLRTQPGELR